MLGSVCCKASTHCGTIRQATIRELVEDSEDTYFGLGRKDAAHGNALVPGTLACSKINKPMMQDGALDFDEFAGG